MRPSALLLALTLAAHAADPTPAPVTIPRDDAAKLKSYDLEKVAEQGSALAGQIVRLKFNYRYREFTEQPDGGLTGELGIFRHNVYYTGPNLKHGRVEVRVPAAGRQWFMKLPSDSNSRPTVVVIARLHKDDDSTLHAELLGREIRTDLKGSHIIW